MQELKQPTTRSNCQSEWLMVFVISKTWSQWSCFAAAGCLFPCREDDSLPTLSRDGSIFKIYQFFSKIVVNNIPKKLPSPIHNKPTATIPVLAGIPLGQNRQSVLWRPYSYLILSQLSQKFVSDVWNLVHIILFLLSKVNNQACASTEI